MKTKFYYTILGICLSSVFSNVALAATQAEANAQLALIPVAATRHAAQEVLNNLVSAGAPVSQALAVVSDAVKHNYNAVQLRQVGAEISEQAQQKISTAYTVKIADKAINANYTTAQTIKTLNTLRDKVNQGKSAEQAYLSVNSGIVNENYVANADNHHSAGMNGASMSANADMRAGAGMGAGAGMASGAGAGMASGAGAGMASGAGAGMASGAGTGMAAGAGMKTGAGIGMGAGAGMGTSMRR